MNFCGTNLQNKIGEDGFPLALLKRSVAFVKQSGWPGLRQNVAVGQHAKSSEIYIANGNWVACMCICIMCANRQHCRLKTYSSKRELLRPSATCRCRVANWHCKYPNYLNSPEEGIKIAHRLSAVNCGVRPRKYTELT